MKRGEIYWVNFGDTGIGSEQTGLRPALVIQNNAGNYHSPTTIVVPITTKHKGKNIPTHVPIKLKKDSVIIFEQIMTVDKSRISEYIGWINPKKWENQLKISLGLGGIK